MKFIKNLLFALLGIVALALFAALFINKEYAVERQVTINRNKQLVFDYIKYLKNQDHYSQWASIDPNWKKEYHGIDGRVGFIAAWDSDHREVGKGEQEIMNMIPGERIDYELRLHEPFESTDQAFMSTEAINQRQTIVKWGFKGKMDYPKNIMLPFLQMDEKLGRSLEVGLNRLKVIQEKQ